jgi:hypothetical protein
MNPNGLTIQRLEIIFDSVKSTTGDKQDVLCIYLNKFLVWVLTSSLGGTLTTVPSNNFNKACCTPSPETSRVIDGLSLYGDFVYFINKNDFFRLWQHHNQLPEADVSRYSTSSPT